VRALQAGGLSQRQACRAARCPRSIAQYRTIPVEPAKLIEQFKYAAGRHRLRGNLFLQTQLRRVGFTVIDKWLYRLYRREGLRIKAAASAACAYVPWRSEGLLSYAGPATVMI
jgi:hypothetical protein